MKKENLNPKDALQFMYDNVPSGTPFKNVNHKVLDKAVEELEVVSILIPELIDLLSKDGIDSKHQAIEMLKELL